MYAKLNANGRALSQAGFLMCLRAWSRLAKAKAYAGDLTLPCTKARTNAS